MAGFFESSGESLLRGNGGDPYRLKGGCSGASYWVYPDPEDRGWGLIVRWSEDAGGRPTAIWKIRADRIYRIAGSSVRRMPPVEEDPDPVRAWCRKYGLPLNRIVRLKRGEIFEFASSRAQGANPKRTIEPGDTPVKMVTHWTLDQDKDWFILVAKGETKGLTLKEVEEILNPQARWAVEVEK